MPIQKTTQRATKTKARAKFNLKREYTAVSQQTRFHMSIMTVEFGLTCYQASSILGVPYTNSKVIMKDYKQFLNPALSLEQRRRVYRAKQLELHGIEAYKEAWQCALNLTLTKIVQDRIKQKYVLKIIQDNFDLFSCDQLYREATTTTH